MNTAEKNLAVKATALMLTTLPQGAIQIDDFSFAIPVTVEGESRYSVVTFTAKNNKDTKTTLAFNPDVARAEWAERKAESERKAQEKAELKEKKIARSKKLREEKENKTEE